MPEQRDRLTATVDQLQAEVDALQRQLLVLGIVLGALAALATLVMFRGTTDVG